MWDLRSAVWGLGGLGGFFVVWGLGSEVRVWGLGSEEQIENKTNVHTFRKDLWADCFPQAVVLKMGLLSGQVT